MAEIETRFVATYEELSPLIDGPYNQPSISRPCDEEEFESEYASFHAGLRRELERFGPIEGYGKGDFSLGNRQGRSRGVGVVIDNEGLFSPSVLKAIKTWVDAFPERYVVVVSGEHRLGEYFYICITKDPAIVGTSERRAWLKPFGFA